MVMHMDITPYVERLRHDLGLAAAAGDEQVRAAADRLTLALDPSLRLAHMEALSQAAAEITSEMRDGSVDVRLAGRDLEFVVEHPTPVAPTPTAAAPAAGEEDDDGATARITLRLPEGVKAKAEELAAKTGSSLNTWIVNVLRAATRDGAINIDIDLSSIPFGEGADPFGPGRGGRRGSRRMTGWV
jgi:hypothetical protein